MSLFTLSSRVICPKFRRALVASEDACGAGVAEGIVSDDEGTVADEEGATAVFTTFLWRARGRRR